MSSASSTTADPGREPTESPSPGQWDHDIIPRTHDSRTLVLCFDGTGDKFDSDVRKPTIDVLLSPTTLISAQ